MKCYVAKACRNPWCPGGNYIDLSRISFKGPATPSNTVHIIHQFKGLSVRVSGCHERDYCCHDCELSHQTWLNGSSKTQIDPRVSSVQPVGLQTQRTSLSAAGSHAPKDKQTKLRRRVQPDDVVKSGLFPPVASANDVPVYGLPAGLRGLKAGTTMTAGRLDLEGLSTKERRTVFARETAAEKKEKATLLNITPNRLRVIEKQERDEKKNAGTGIGSRNIVRKNTKAKQGAVNAAHGASGAGPLASTNQAVENMWKQRRERKRTARDSAALYMKPDIQEKMGARMVVLSLGRKTISSQRKNK
ncbi:hypothetical protein EK21DRAFT_85190 [Setomelanomma holmii]|uniref:Uncharacterized protein n=1 Tax=Setomelanomma holmii TaxID=210430 RepID=A0A9P4HIF0_9PLEO|nr:hypothetical protein EK21DRAFT_85190 [Setomelanomma holmii]